MARRWTDRASVRVRATVAAVLVVAVVMVAGSVLLVLLLRESLIDGVESTAEQRASDLADQIERSGVPSQGENDDDDDDDDPEDTLVVVRTEEGSVVFASESSAASLPSDGADSASVPGADHDYVVVTEDADFDDQEYVVSVGVSREDADESTAALVPLLTLALPVALLVVGMTTWVVVGRALAPVERMRRQVDAITGESLDTRLEPPPTRDEIHRLALTMNAMLDRLAASRERQQRFVSDASHELRSPLAGIRQTAEVARAHPGAMPEGELADAVLEESARMQRLVEQMLLLTRADEGGGRRAPGEVDLDDLVLAEVERVRRMGSVGVDGSDVAPARTWGDRTALAQVVRNLVDNGVRHARTRIAVSCGSAPDGAWLTVDDDGSGVPPGERERIFERFVRLDESRARDDGGSGLGLAIVREIAGVHGGEAHVTDSPMGGARFVVRLPAAP
ncbi:histidine kinase [Nocardioides sp. Soil797]|nr:histidine kinase [Nocardioides sp. Soil797]